MRIVFMGAPEFSVPILERLLLGEHELVSVYTHPDRPAGRGRALVFSAVKKVALERGLKVLQPASFKEPVAIEFLARLRPDVIVVAAFGRILPGEVLAMPPFGCINLHPSLLPRHRGPSPVQGAILAGDDWTGVTMMLMDEGVDSGPILSQRKVAIEPQDTTESLTKELAQVAAQLLEETLPLWLSHSLSPRPQGEEGATYTKLFSKEEGEIDWHLGAVEIWRRVRAFHPWPGCYTRWQGKILKILDATPIAGGRDLEPGRVIAVAPGQGAALGVETGEGVLGLLRIQLEGRRAMTVEEFLRGQRGFLGALLPASQWPSP
ncbi:MAG: methionyl-tRNA formyltransferase [Dehalococcoidia bacterium]